MTRQLIRTIERSIRKDGPMNMADFTEMVLAHPKYGYYINQKPFGVEGDFITAPEVSQMFGEVLGAWMADLWIQMGEPPALNIVECGPGRGTLMADALRGTTNVAGFHKAVKLHLVEVSEALQKQQAKALKKFKPTFHKTLKTIPRNLPLILIGNEFVDVLPVRQLQKTKNGWKEIAVTLKSEITPDKETKTTTTLKNAVLEQSLQAKDWIAAHFPNVFSIDEGYSPFTYTYLEFTEKLIDIMPEDIQGAQQGEVFEFSPAREKWMKELCTLLKDSLGCGVLIDYGYDAPKTGPTLQAIMNHERYPPLYNVGLCDVSADVDFSALKKNAEKNQAITYGPVGQGYFLERIGIVERAKQLALKANKKETSQELKEALKRLCSPQEMGKSFRVLGLSYDPNITPGGFQ